MDLDEELIRTFFKGLMKLSSTSLPNKHTKRLQVIFRIPNRKMELESRCLAKVDAWAKRSTSDKEKLATHASQSIEDIQSLQTDQPLQVALRDYERGMSKKKLREEQWADLEAQSKVDNPDTSRHIQTNEISEQQEHQFPRFPTVEPWSTVRSLRNRVIAPFSAGPALKRAMTRWCIYKFPVRYKLTKAEEITLGQIRYTDELDETQYKTMLEGIRDVFNGEQGCWGMCKLSSCYRPDVRHRLRWKPSRNKPSDMKPVAPTPLLLLYLLFSFLLSILLKRSPKCCTQTT